MEALGIERKQIEDLAHWRRNLLGLVRGRVYYNINSWYTGLTYLPSFGRNKQDMEEMMGLKDPVDFVHDQFGMWEKIQKLPSMIANMIRLYCYLKASYIVPPSNNITKTLPKVFEKRLPR